MNSWQLKTQTTDIHDFVKQLECYGPDRSGEGQHSLDESRAYCRRPARTHYENFSVVNLLMPRRLRQHFANIYAYCRWADDLADETNDSELSIRLLAWWKEQLEDCYRGRANHPVFIALLETVEEFDIPQQPFLDLLSAFRQDQKKKRYETFDELQGYCRNSANPVGQLVLYLGRCHTEKTTQLSDSICTGLQLVNFWQDVRRDYESGRVYLPAETTRRFGYLDSMFESHEFNIEFRGSLASEVDRAESYLSDGWPLVELVSSDVKIPVELFIRGGLSVVQAIRRIDYNVWQRRPTVGRWTKMRLLAWTLWRHRRTHG